MRWVPHAEGRGAPKQCCSGCVSVLGPSGRKLCPASFPSSYGIQGPRGQSRELPCSPADAKMRRGGLALQPLRRMNRGLSVSVRRARAQGGWKVRGGSGRTWQAEQTQAFHSLETRACLAPGTAEKRLLSLLCAFL